MPGQEQEPRNMCCFCDQPITVQGTDPCDLTLSKEWWRHIEDEWECDSFFCHLERFRQRLHPDYIAYLDEPLPSA